LSSDKTVLEGSPSAESLMVPKKPTSGQKVNDALKTWSVLLVGVAGLLIWHYSVVLTGIQDFILPGPLQVASAFQMQLQDPLFYEHLTITFRAAITGFFLASVIAISLGTAVSQVKVIERMIMPYVAAIQTIPKVALAPLFVIWFGYGISSKVVMSAVICFFPILINVIEGLNSADSERIRMLTVFGAKKRQIFKMVKLPSALPFIFAGLDIGIVFAILGAVVGEFLGAQRGLGVLILQTQYTFDIAGMFAALVVLSMMGFTGHMIILALKRKFAFWAVS
jgi:NitT/TauT family transport system permease protein